MKQEMMSWLDALVNASQNAVNKVIRFTPNVVVALLLLLLGTLAGRWIGNTVEKILTKIKFSEFISGLHLNRYLEPFGLRSVQELIGKLVHFFIFLIALIAATDIVHLPQVTELIRTVLLFIPKAVMAFLILLVGLMAVRLSEGFLKGDLLQRAPALKGVIRFLIVTFALLAALEQFGVSPRMIEILFTGLIFSMSLATGLAFGLGGKEVAKEVLERLKGRSR